MASRIIKKRNRKAYKSDVLSLRPTAVCRTRELGQEQFNQRSHWIEDTTTGEKLSEECVYAQTAWKFALVKLTGSADAKKPVYTRYINVYENEWPMFKTADEADQAYFNLPLPRPIRMARKIVKLEEGNWD